MHYYSRQPAVRRTLNTAVDVAGIKILEGALASSTDTTHADSSTKTTPGFYSPRYSVSYTLV